MCRAFDGHLSGARHESGALNVTAAKADQVLRHRLWLKRKQSSAGDFGGWKPPKRYRVAAKHWALNVDNSLRHTLGLEGLVAFRVPDEADRKGTSWEGWRGWRHLLVSADQGSDGVCAMNYLLDKQVHMSVIADWSHGAQNDLKECLRSASLYPYMLLMMVVFNVEHGPWREDLRFSQVREAWQEASGHYTSKTCELFRAYADRIIQELRDADVVDFYGRDDPEDSLWEYMKNSDLGKGYMTCLNRYFAVIEKGAEMCGVWHLRRCQYELVALESGQLHTSKLQPLLLRDPEAPGEPSAAASSTAPNRPCVSEKSAADPDMARVDQVVGGDWLCGWLFACSPIVEDRPRYAMLVRALCGAP